MRALLWLGAALVAIACSSSSAKQSEEAGGGDEGSIGDDAAMGDDAPAGDDAPQMANGDPPFGASSNGTGGPAPVQGSTEQAGGVTYRLIVPSSYRPAAPTPLLVVYS